MSNYCIETYYKVFTMPKNIIDYSNTTIYKITCKDESCKEIYVGYTTNFVQKKYIHKQSCTNTSSPYYNLPLYNSIRENGGWDNWYVDIVNVFCCKDSNEAKKLEKEHGELLNASVVSEQFSSKIDTQPKTNTTFYCDVCKIYTSSNELMEKHKQRKKHLNLTLVNSSTNKSHPRYDCKICNFVCFKESEWNRHILTTKHERLTNANKKTPKNAEGLCDCLCGNVYKHSSSLSKHKKTCGIANLKKGTVEEDFDLKSLFLDMVKQNEEFKKLLIDQHKENHELHKKMLELQNNQSITNNNNGTINNTTNKFNLNFFLNETCKDAMNIQEFIDYVKVQHSDFENFGKYGYVESMTRIIMRNLMELEVHRRPIHCTDAKREVLYVKDNNVWVNDFSREKLIRAIKYIAAKNVKQIPGWMDHNPDSKNTQTKLHDKYMRMVCHSMGGRDEAEDQEYYKKIIHNLAKEVVIDKMK